MASCGLLVASALAAELVITSFPGNGELTWTNSASSHATYRVEWASSATGPWSRFDALTNLTLISATSNLVTVKVPMFYRVVWLDAPVATGTWNYSGYDEFGSLVVTGKLYLSAQTNRVSGRWDLLRVGDLTGEIGPQVGQDELEGWLNGTELMLNLNPGWVDNNVYLVGQLAGTNYSGRWAFSGFPGELAHGTFRAEKQLTNDTIIPSASASGPATPP